MGRREKLRNGNVRNRDAKEWKRNAEIGNGIAETGKGDDWQLGAKQRNCAEKNCNGSEPNGAEVCCYATEWHRNERKR